MSGNIDRGELAAAGEAWVAGEMDSDTFWHLTDAWAEETVNRELERMRLQREQSAATSPAVTGIGRLGHFVSDKLGIRKP